MSIQPRGGAEVGRVAGARSRTTAARPRSRTSCASSSSMPSAAVGSGRLGIRSSSASRSLVGLRQLGLRLGQLVGEPPELGRAASGPAACPWTTFFCSARRRLGPLGELAPAGVGGEQRVEVFRRAAAGQRGPVAVRILPGGLEVDHLRESSGAACLRSRMTRLAAESARSSGGAAPAARLVGRGRRRPAAPAAGAGRGRQHRAGQDQHERGHIAGVSGSPSTATPSATATAGLT